MPNLSGAKKSFSPHPNSMYTVTHRISVTAFNWSFSVLCWVLSVERGRSFILQVWREVLREYSKPGCQDWGRKGESPFRRSQAAAAHKNWGPADKKKEKLHPLVHLLRFFVISKRTIRVFMCQMLLPLPNLVIYLVNFYTSQNAEEWMYSSCTSIRANRSRSTEARFGPVNRNGNQHGAIILRLSVHVSWQFLNWLNKSRKASAANGAHVL